MCKSAHILCFLSLCFFLLSAPTVRLVEASDDDSPAYVVEKAAGRGNIKAVRTFLRQKKRYKADEYAWGKGLAFVAAAMHGHNNIVRLLLQHGVDVNFCNDNDGSDITALSAAAMEGHLSTMRILLAQKASVNKQSDPGETTALMYAAIYGQVKAMRLLLKHKAKVNIYEDNGRTALMYAAGKGSLPAVQLLLKYKADVNMHPSKEKSGDFIDTTAWPPLIFAAYEGHLPVVQLLLKHGAKVDAHGHGQTAFMMACKKNHLPIAKLLLAKGANINAISDYGETALSLATEAKAEGVVQWLLKNGASSQQ